LELIESLHESQIINLWRYLLLKEIALIAEDGTPVKIIYPGRINDDQGADFRDAVMVTKQGLVIGDIEIHVKSSDWQAHRHHLNPQYNRVILHVVMKSDRKKATYLENGRSIPTLALNKYIGSSIPLVDPRTVSNTPCSGCCGSLSPDIIAEFLDSAGKQRLLTKANEFEANIAQVGASQSLYEGLYLRVKYQMKNVLYDNRL